MEEIPKWNEDLVYIDITEAKWRIAEALGYARAGQVEGDQHKAWAIDQIVRCLTGCPDVVDSEGGEYKSHAKGESEAYRSFVSEVLCDEDGPYSYVWNTGIAP